MHHLAPIRVKAALQVAEPATQKGTMTTNQTADAPSLARQAGLSYFPIAFVARLPYAMMVVGMLTLVVAVRGSLTLGGLTSAFAGVGTAIFGPLIGAAADRFGQRPVLLATALLNGSAMAALALLVSSPAPDQAVLAAAFVIGSSAPQVSPMSRSRLFGIIQTRIPAAHRARVLGGTMAYESAADEVTFVFGPVIVGILATGIAPAAPVYGAALLTLVFVAAFALHRSGRTVLPHTPGEQPGRAPIGELFRGGILVTMLGTLGMGLLFGSTLTWLTSFMDDRGVPEQAGLVYGAMGLSSAVLALGVAWFPRRFTTAARWLAFAGVLLAGMLALALVHDVGASAIVLFLAGVGVGPTLVTLYHLAAERSPRGRSATVMTMLGSALILGQASSAATTGAIAQNLGTDRALLIPVVAAVVVLAAGLLNLPFARRDAAQLPIS